ncbi:class I SAM-dependent methyltransferase [Streptomyces arenae]|nr:class I SAM-dependent methyltransferase [Streptomyces arenae]
MPTTSPLNHGDFTDLAHDYSRYREGYAPAVLDAVTGLLPRLPAECDAADVGAGTGIWTRMLASAGFRSVTAVEPNDAMRATGIDDSAATPIAWRHGTGEHTTLPDRSADLLTMASSFHWVDFEHGMAEFARVVRPGGWFVALWNPRDIEASPLLSDIEAELARIEPKLERVSSGRSGTTRTLTERLSAHPSFDHVIYLEGRHTVRQSPQHYVGAWRSVNDVRVQLGEAGFSRFLDYVTDRLDGVDAVETTYLTRAWAARRVAP